VNGMDKDEKIALRSSDIGKEIDNDLKIEIHRLLENYECYHDLDRDEVRKKFPFASLKANY